MGPEELIAHAIEHCGKDTAFDQRIAFISVDNAVEMMIRTYLSLPQRARGGPGPSRAELETARNSFPALLDLLERYEPSDFTTVLGDIEYYHRTRNQLYHEGNGITVDPDLVDAYLQIARGLFTSLFNVEPKLPEPAHAATDLGRFVEAWSRLETNIRFHANRITPTDDRTPLGSAVETLWRANVISDQYVERYRRLWAVRNAIVHGLSNPDLSPDYS